MSLELREVGLCDALAIIYTIFPDAIISYHPDDIIVVAYNQQPLGFIHFGFRRGKARIFGLGVLPAHRRKGIAKTLLNHAIRRIASFGFSKVYLRVRKDNSVAMHLYTSMGFSAYREKEPFVYMVKRLR